MKKLLFAVMAAAMASVASAATGSDMWTFQNNDVYSFRAGYKAETVGSTCSDLLGAGYSVYYIGVKVKVDDATTRQATIVAAANSFLNNLRSGQTAEQAAGSDLLASSTIGSDSKAVKASGSVDRSYYHTLDSIEVMDAITAVVAEGNVLLLTNYGKVDDKTYYTGGNGSNTRIDIDGTGNYSTWGWYAIPEPTSGLLLLIGMAGLALKRKRT